ncbi:MAG: 50S ribosomal protein L1 [Candidatus Saccharimonadales bacterium]
MEQKSPRSHDERAGKKYREAIKQIDKSKVYNLAEAVDLAAKTSTSKFDATVEMHINLAVDPKQSDQNVRDTVVMPHGTGKAVRIAVFAEGDDIDKAKKAGADIAGNEEILTALDKERVDFDILISTPALMSKLGKYARLLGPKGLMPNPKSGTVTTDTGKAVKEARAGRVEYRVDQSGIIHLGIGKVSFGPQKLLENAQTIATSVRSAKPASVKGTYVKSAYIASTMGPSVKTEI